MRLLAADASIQVAAHCKESAEKKKTSSSRLPQNILKGSFGTFLEHNPSSLTPADDSQVACLHGKLCCTVKVQLLLVMKHKFSGSFLLCSAPSVYQLSRSTAKSSDQAPPLFSSSYQRENAKTRPFCFQQLPSFQTWTRMLLLTSSSNTAPLQNHRTIPSRAENSQSSL